MDLKADFMKMGSLEETAVIESMTTDSQTIKSGRKELLLRNPLTAYIEALAIELKTSDKVTKNLVLKSDKWTKSCYDLLSKNISEDLKRNMSADRRMALGTSLSAKTLQKIASANYKISFPIDPRTLNTLNKVVVFLGYKNWNNFIDAVDGSKTRKAKDPEEEIKNVVKEAVKQEYLTYCNLPKVEGEHLTDIYIRDSSSFNMIMDTLVTKAAKKQIISNSYNPSACEILEMEVKKLEGNYAQVYTKEYWLLCWWDTVKKKYVKRFKDISDHFYILHKEEGRWMIKTNASTSDLMELV